MPSTEPTPRPPRNPRQGHRLNRALVAVPLLAAAGWLGRKAWDVPHDAELPAPVPGDSIEVRNSFGRIAIYEAAPSGLSDGAVPLLLVHSINAAASAYEVRPLFQHYARSRPVYALDLPGYGHSDRPARLYTPQLMIDAIMAAIDLIQRRHGARPIDALALSLSSEFLARAAVEHPALFRSIALVSPTGFDKRGPRLGAANSNRGIPAVYKAVTVRLWRRTLFDLLTSRVSIRYFLEKTFGSKRVDEGLVDYDYLTAHRPDAEHAPYSFLSGFLFSNDITRVYEALRRPVWMLHGTRGDFQDYSDKVRVANRRNWTIDVLDTGALPHFEMLEAFATRYDAFLAAAGANGA